jgi:lysophospholipase L1-like esterase
MAEDTTYLGLYKWDKTDNKIETIGRMAANSEKVDNKLSEHNTRLDNAEAQLSTISPIIEDMEIATQSTKNATHFANEAIENANTAATLATEKANLASEKATFAESKATEALTQANYAKEKADYIASKEMVIDKFTDEQTNLQAQINQLVVEGDSSPAVAQAKVNKKGTVYATLKERLDDENEKVNASLAESATQVDVLSYLQPINFLSKVRTDHKKVVVVGIGDSHLWGQGADNAVSTGQERPPFTNGKSFFEQFSNLIESKFGVGSWYGKASVNVSSVWKYTGAGWVAALQASPTSFGGYYKLAKNQGDYCIATPPVGTKIRKIRIWFTKTQYGGIFRAWFKRSTDADWLNPNSIANIRRYGLSADGAIDNMGGSETNKVDTYHGSNLFGNWVEYVFPEEGDWAVKLDVGSTKNASSLDYWMAVEGIQYSNSVSYNWGKGGHTTQDYLGIQQLGGTDLTNHFQEVLNFSPSLVLFEPMAINDFIHQVPIVTFENNIKSMITQLRAINCDIILMTPAPISLTSTPYDYSGTPYVDTSKPIKYQQYIDSIRSISIEMNVRLFVDGFGKLDREYNASSHQYWFNDSLHVNQVGHDLYVNEIVNKFTLIK